MESNTCRVIGDFVSLQRGTTYKSKLLDLPGPYLLGLGSIERNGGFRSGKLRTYGGPTQDKLLVYPGDLYVSLKDITQAGDLLGSIARVPSDISVGRMTQDTVKLVFDGEEIDRRYLYWCLRTPLYKNYCRARALGTTNLSLSRTDFLSYPIPPFTLWRKRLVDLLEAVEAKIELNRQINATLESMARALFKSWFVDFDPVIDNALAAGNDIPEPLQAKAEKRKALGDKRKPLPDGLHQQFPDRFVFTEEMGWVPEGWRVCSLIEMIKLIGGGTPKTSVPEYWGGDIPWFSVVDAPKSNDVFCIQTEKHTTEAGVENSSTKVLRVGTTIISARGTVGKCAIAGVPMAMNQSCYGIEGAAGYTDYFVYYSVLKNVADLQQRSHGSVFSTITRGTFETIKVPGVPASMAAEFDRTVGEFMNRIVNNLNQISALSKLRDTLLPKLLSGELRIPEAEKQIAEAV